MREPVILMVDDDEDDFFLAKSALERTGTAWRFLFVCDGLELMDYLHCEGKFCDPELFPWPNLILLDLNMPRKDGREALKEMKSHPKLCEIPVVILSTSKDERDIAFCRDTGALTFIAKPVRFEEWVEAMRSLNDFKTAPVGDSGAG